MSLALRLPAPLAVMLLVVVLPSAIALALYFSGWRPAGSNIHGEFLRPPPSLAGLDLAAGPDAGHAAVWRLLYLPAGECERSCVAALYGLRMAHLAQGKDRQRVSRVVLASTAELAAHLARQDQEIRVLAPDRRAPLLGALQQDAGQAAIYLIDPMGNAILRYPEDADPNGIRKDLAHLLKHSWVG